jgi:hypothetical protein
MRALLFVGLAACTASPPAEAPAIGADFTASVNGTTLTLSMQLRAAGSDDIEGVHAQFRGQDIAIEAPYVTSVSLDSEVAEAEPIVFSLGETSVAVIAPADFAIAPPAPTPASQPVVVTWSPTSSDPMHWSADRTCAAPGDYNEGPIPQDTGRIEFPPGVLSFKSQLASCTLTLELDRMRSNLTAPQPLGSTATFTRVHTTAVEVTP